MEVGLVLDVTDFVDELKLHFVVDFKLLVALADLHLQVVVRLLNFSDVHLLQLKRSAHFYSPSSFTKTKSARLLSGQGAVYGP